MENKNTFRGKTEDGRWVYGHLFILGEGTEYEETYILGYLDERESIYDVWKCAEKVIPETVGRCAGLRDMNDQMIYEGDVFNYASTITYSVIWSEDRLGFYADGGCEINLESDYLGNFHSCYCKVIGNIHDTPELIQ